ncbi:MAG TPA: hypothetical protein VGG03_14445 [Thermoanaerobaculia bacterium]|jgi:hypothetical protein
MQDLKRMQAVTENFFLWQGLRLVPFGLMGIFYAIHLAEPSWWPLQGVSNELILVAVLALTLVAFSWIGRYYDRNFGKVRGLPGRHARRDAIKWWVVYPAMGASLFVDGVLKPPVFVSGLVWGAAVVAYWASTGRGRRHYLAIAALFAALTFVPALGLVSAGKAMIGLFMGVLGGVYILAGIFDHLELVRILRPVREEE